MARNKPTKPLAEAPPEPDSSEEEEEPEEEHSSTESDEKPLSAATDADADDDDEEDEQQLKQSPATPPPPFSPPSKKPTTKKPTTSAAAQSSSSDEDKEESDSDDEPELPVSKLKSTSKPTSKPTSPPPKSRSKPTIASLPAEKRPSDTTSLDKEKSSKKPKKDTSITATPSSKPTPLSPGPGPSEDGSKKLFQRVFSEEDEIEILKGLSDFKERKGSDPLKNDDEFYGLIKKRVHAEVNKAQMNDKVRRLKRKFVNNAKNKKRKSLNDHESKLFELSKRIWEVKDEDDDGDVKVSNGGGGVVVKEGEKSSSKKSGKSYSSNDDGKDNGVVGVKSVSRSKEEESEGGEGDGDEMEEDFRVGENEVKGERRWEALRRMGEKGRNEIREIWRKVENAQLEVDLMRSQARVEENKRIMEALGLLKR